MSILSVEMVHKSFGEKEVLKGVSIEIERPGIYALVGPNGSGKTTLFNVISNLLKMDEGEVWVNEKENTNPEIFRNAAFLKDNRVLYDYMTGLDHLSFIRFAQKLPKSRVAEVVDKIGIRDYVRNRVSTYSLGMKQHLLLAMAMMNKPALMILDEPFNGLDPTSVIRVRELLKELSEENTAVLVSSHTLSEIDLMTDHIFFLKNGRVIEENYDRNKEPDYLFTLLGNEDIEKAKSLENCKVEGNVLSVNLSQNGIGQFLKTLEERGIRYSEINRKRFGAEDRYRAMFPEEIGA